MTLPNKANVIGIDECAVGTLVGPLVMCAVLVPVGYGNPEIQDSKQIDKKKIPDLAKDIIKNCSVITSFASVETIDLLGTWVAWDNLIAHLAFMHRSKFGHRAILIDGNRNPKTVMSLKTIEKGDSIWMQIAAASIVAKYHQMEMMKKIHEEFPHYNFDSNAGYGSTAHYRALKEHGPTRYHRRAATKSFLSRPPRIS